MERQEHDKVLNLAKLLGEASPADFKTEDEIAEYFDEDNIRRMFPDEEIDPDLIDEACHTCITEWRSSLSLTTGFEKARDSVSACSMLMTPPSRPPSQRRSHVEDLEDEDNPDFD